MVVYILGQCHMYLKIAPGAGYSVLNPGLYARTKFLGSNHHQSRIASGQRYWIYRVIHHFSQPIGKIGNAIAKHVTMGKERPLFNKLFRLNG